MTVGSAAYTSEVDGVMTPTRGAVTGVVTETGTGDPIVGARVVVLNGTNGRPEIGAVTGPTGQYTLSRLSPGPRLVFALDPSGAHAPRFSPSELDTSTADHPVVAAGATATADVTLPAQAGGAGPAPVTGTVREQGTGRRLANSGCWHCATATSASPGRPRPAAPAPTSSRWRRARTASPSSTSPAATRCSGTRASPTPPSARRPRSRPPPPSTPPSPPPPHRSAAPSTDETLGHPLGSAWVVAIGPTGVAGGTVTAADGTYELSGLPTGTYRVTAVGTDGVHLQRFWTASPDYDGATPISLVAPTTWTADLRLPAP